jgi:hypothetical protein
MGRLPTNLRLLEAEVRECGESYGSLALIVAGQTVILPPWGSCSVLRPGELVRVLIRSAPDGGLDPLIVQRSADPALVPLSPRIAPEIFVLGAAILAISIFSQIWWLLAVPVSLALVQGALSARRRRALRWFRLAEATTACPSLWRASGSAVGAKPIDTAAGDAPVGLPLAEPFRGLQ